MHRSVGAGSRIPVCLMFGCSTTLQNAVFIKNKPQRLVPKGLATVRSAPWGTKPDAPKFGVSVRWRPTMWRRGAKEVPQQKTTADALPYAQPQQRQPLDFAVSLHFANTPQKNSAEETFGTVFFRAGLSSSSFTVHCLRFTFFQIVSSARVFRRSASARLV